MRIAVRCVAATLILLFASSSVGLAFSQEHGADLIGRWDLTVKGKDGDYPSWIEVKKSGFRTLVGSFVGQFGSARPVSEFRLEGNELRFEIPPQWEGTTKALVFEGKLRDGKLSGVTLDTQGNEIEWTGTRAPSLKREKAPVWGEAKALFNGKDLYGWTTQFSDRDNGWIVRDGLLVNDKPGNNILTTSKFEDFQLNAEFRYPKGSNSGIYLRGRYEVQIEDNFGGEPESHRIGGVYGFLTPSINASKPAGEWQDIEITLVGRVVTVILNGERIIDRQAIPGITGGALDNAEGEPGPIMIQGDHGPVEFRLIEITPAK